MGWSTLLFAEKEHLCYKVTNKLLCEQFVDRLRQDFCLPEAENTVVNRQRNRLIAALDFGVKGEIADETVGRDACECAGFCTPPVEVPQEGFGAWLKDLYVKRGFLKSVLDATLNKKYLQEMYRETLVQEELKQCVVGIPMPRPILPATQKRPAINRVWEICPSEEEQEEQKAQEEDTIAAAEDEIATNAEEHPPVPKKKSSKSGNAMHAMQCVIGEDYSPILTGIFVNRVSYMGHCRDDYMCFESDYMNQAEPGRTLLEQSPADDPETPTLSVFDLSGNTDRDDDNTFMSRQASKLSRRGSDDSGRKEIVRFKSWGKSPASREYWTHRGIVYAELLKSPSTGMQKIVVIESGISTEPMALKQVQQWFAQHLELTGHNEIDPRKVLEIEDRDGNDMCMFMYSLCCAIGGVLKQDKENTDYHHLKEQCPSGSVCCPKTVETKTSPSVPVPWGPNTIRLLHVLSHGKLKGAPSMDIHHSSQGWASHDPISSSGPSLCVDPAALKDVFPNNEEQAASRSVAKASELRKTEDASNPNVVCRFVCQMDKNSGRRMVRNKPVPCVDGNGRKIDVRVGPVKQGTCVLSSYNVKNLINAHTAMQKEAMDKCAAFALKHLADGRNQLFLCSNCNVVVN